jgi:hypothetical protein
MRFLTLSTVLSTKDFVEKAESDSFPHFQQNNRLKIRINLNRFSNNTTCYTFRKRRRINVLKGVNKLIIEVSNPESVFFERAIFFVKPGKSDAVTRELNESVHSIVGKAEAASKAGRLRPMKPHSKSPKNLTTLKLAGAAGLGALAAGIIMRLL